MRPGGLLFSSKRAALPPNPGHAPADANLRPARLGVQTRWRKFSITAAGWAAYESLRAHGASTRQSLQCPANHAGRLRLCLCLLSRRENAGHSLAPHFSLCSKLSAAHSFLLRGRLRTAVFFQCAREGFFFSSKRAALPPNPVHAPADGIFDPRSKIGDFHPGAPKRPA